jgi:putative sporulation protein YtxC
MNKQIYDTIIKKFIDTKTDDIFAEEYFFLNVDLHKQIKDTIIKVMIDEQEIEKHIDIECYTDLKKKINDIIEEQLDGKEVKNINGFITFRMIHFEGVLVDMFDAILEPIIVDREYEEFIKLLKYFIDIQESKIDTLVVEFLDSDYLLQDIDGNDVKEEMEQITEDIDIPYSDRLVSALIYAAPKKIIIKSIEKCTNKELIETTKKMFDSKIEIK